MSCHSHSTAPVLEILHTETLDTIPSGSGLATTGSRLFILGDDAAYLYELDLAYQLRHQYLLLPDHVHGKRIPKATKPDLESLFLDGQGDTAALYAFGSGSKTPGRDLMLRIPLEQPNAPQTYTLTPFYDRLTAAMDIEREQLNLEGALVMADTLYLLNRGTNTLIGLSWPRFLEYLQGHLSASQLHIALHRYKLPTIQGKEARFSGACAVPGSRKILFTASVEDTQNWIDDGEVLGSFIGLLDPQVRQEDLTGSSWLVADAQGAPLRQKLESVEVLPHVDEQLNMAAVADNDDGTSTLLVLRLRPWK